MTRREFSGNAKPTQLDADVTDSATSLTIRNASGWPTGAVGPFAAVINRGKADEEKILVTTRTGTSLDGVTRGYDNTTAVAHTSTATVEHCASAIDLDEANDHINDTSNDAHTQYLNTTRHDAHDHTTALSSAAFSDLGTKTHTHQDAAGGGQLDHGAALTGLTDDDHTQYLLANGTRALNGPLDHDGSTVGFFGVTPTTRPVATAEIKAALALLGLLTDGGASPLNLDGGKLTCDEAEIDGALNHDGTTVGFYGVAPATRPAAIADASTAHALSAVFTDTEVETALNNLGTKINAIIAALESVGLLAT